MGRSRCRRGWQYGDEWQRQHGGGKRKPQFNGATISFVFLKCQKKTPIFIFFSKNLPPPEICRPRRPPSPPNGKTASADTIGIIASRK
jgi:hypothetical protein